MDDAIQIGSQWYIPVVSPRADDRARVLKGGDTFAVLDRHGEISRVGLGEQGLYSLGARHLSLWGLAVSGHSPLLLNSTVKLDNSVLVVDQTTPDLYAGGRLYLAKGTLHLHRNLAVHDGALFERTQVVSYHGAPVTLELEYRYDADFCDIFEVRGAQRLRRGQLLAPRLETPQAVILAYQGLDAVTRRTRISFEGPLTQLEPERARFALRLDPGVAVEIEARAACASGEGYFSRVSHRAAVRELDRTLAEGASQRTEILTDNEQFNDWVNRSAADLQMLITETRYGPYPYAGVPWFSTPFGRDGLITALQTLWIQPSLARGVLAFLAATQAQHEDPATEAQPGKILHELREGEMPALGEVPFRRYYGTVDATPLFVMLAGRYYQRSGDLAFIEDLWPSLERAMDWVEHRGDMDGDGFVEYARHGPTGLVQQGWKDSDDSIFHADGTPAEPPIALCEVQGYVYAACRLGAELATALGHTHRAAHWQRRADALRQAFEARFWVESLGTYALALDGAKRPCAVRTSNPGHALWCGIADDARAARVATGLLAPAGFNGWGVRTVFAGETRYNPMSYHNGSVWPHDTAIAAAGLARYGFSDRALELLTGMFNASIFLDLHRLPELFCGFDRLPGQAPTLYPVACAPQAWASGAVFMLIQACLGIGFSHEAPHIRFHHPRLPDYINQMWIKGLGFGGNRVDLAIRRHGSDVALHVEARRGELDVALVL